MTESTSLWTQSSHDQKEPLKVSAPVLQHCGIGAYLKYNLFLVSGFQEQLSVLLPLFQA